MGLINHNISSANDGLGDQLRTAFENQNTMNAELYDETGQLLKNKSEIKSPIQYYGTQNIFVDYHNGGGYDLTGDIAFADDREGVTGKLWAFYFDSYTGMIRREMPYVGCSPAELGAEVVVTIEGGRVNHFAYVDGFWYVGCGANIYKFNSGITSNPTLLGVISAAGSNGDNVYVANLCFDKDETTGVWHAYYATYNGTAPIIRHATASDPSGAWTIASGAFAVPTSIDPSLNWIRIYKIMKDKQGRLWAVVGAGDRWKGTGEPDGDDGASVWVSPASNYNTLASDWTLIVKPPYFPLGKLPNGSPFVNNAYAPSFLQDGDDWYLYVNTGEYGHERILALSTMAKNENWYNPINTEIYDVPVTGTSTPIEYTKIVAVNGAYKLNVQGYVLNYSGSAQYHAVRISIKNETKSEVISEAFITNGLAPYENKFFTIDAVIYPKYGEELRVYVNYEVGFGQVTPTDSRIRGLSFSLSKIN